MSPSKPTVNHSFSFLLYEDAPPSANQTCRQDLISQLNPPPLALPLPLRHDTRPTPRYFRTTALHSSCMREVALPVTSQHRLFSGPHHSSVLCAVVYCSRASHRCPRAETKSVYHTKPSFAYMPSTFYHFHLGSDPTVRLGLREAWH